MRRHGPRVDGGGCAFLRQAFMCRRRAAQLGQWRSVVRRGCLLGSKTGGQQAEAKSFGNGRHEARILPVAKRQAALARILFIDRQARASGA